MGPRNRNARAPEGVREDAIAWLARLRSDPSEQDQAAFENWYAADPRHADSYDALLDSWDATQLVSMTPVARPVRPRPLLPWGQVAAAAAVLLVVVAGLFLAGNPGTVSPPDAILASSIGEIRTITLDDGSRVTLDTDSTIRVRLGAAERRLVLERGRARFEVAHDARRPFIVAAGARELVAHGTVFDVDLRQPRPVVSLLEGSVEVREPPSSKTGGKSTMLRPGQRLALGLVAPVPARIEVSELRWPSGMLSFEDAPLAEVVASANRYGRTRIVIGDPSVGERRFTGTIRAGDTRQLAEMIGSMPELSLASDGAGNLVLAARK